MGFLAAPTVQKPNEDPGSQCWHALRGGLAFIKKDGRCEAWPPQTESWTPPTSVLSPFSHRCTLWSKSSQCQMGETNQKNKSTWKSWRRTEVEGMQRTRGHAQGSRLSRAKGRQWHHGYLYPCEKINAKKAELKTNTFSFIRAALPRGSVTQIPKTAKSQAFFPPQFAPKFLPFLESLPDILCDLPGRRAFPPSGKLTLK